MKSEDIVRAISSARGELILQTANNSHLIVSKECRYSIKKMYTLDTINRVAPESMGGVGTWELENSANVVMGEVKLYSYNRFTLNELSTPQSRILSTFSPFLISVIRDIESEDVKRKTLFLKSALNLSRTPIVFLALKLF